MHAAWLIAASMLFACPVGAAEPPVLTERQAVELALSRPAYREIEEGRLAVAESEVAEAGMLPNPAIALERERTGVPGGRSTESSARLSQTFDVSGRRALRKEAAVSRLEAARFDQQEQRLNTANEVRRIFGEALHRQRVRAALDGWLQRIESATATVARLAKAGEASGYDRRRLEREAQTARARAAGAAADYGRLSEALTGLIGGRAAPAIVLGGELLPEAPPVLERLQDMLRRRPAFASLGSQAEAYDRELTAAGRAWIPDITLEVGQKRVEEPGRSDNGQIFGISVPLPLFDRGQAGQQRSRARASVARAEQGLLLAKSEAELRGAWRQSVELRQVAADFRREALTAAREIVRIAEAAYRGGEGSILELLDAYRGELEAETTALELELRARLARIELDALSGARFHEN